MELGIYENYLLCLSYSVLQGKNGKLCFFFLHYHIFSLCFCSLWVESVFVPTGFELSLGHYFDECVVNMCEQHPSVRQT